MVLGLFALGAGWDLWRVHHPVTRWPEAAPPADRRAPAVSGPPGPAPATVTRTSPPVSVSKRIDVNHADAGELDQLPGIGPVLAGRIVEHRQAHGPYRTLEDLLAVRGIGPTLLERLRDRVTLGPEPPAPGNSHDPGKSHP